MKLLKMILLLLIITLNSSILHSQHISTDSLCFSKSEATLIMQDLKRVDLLDSIVTNQKHQIVNYRYVDKMQQNEILLVNTRLSKVRKDLKKVNLQLKISKKLTFIGVPTALLGGFMIGYILK